MHERVDLIVGAGFFFGFFFVGLFIIFCNQAKRRSLFCGNSKWENGA